MTCKNKVLIVGGGLGALAAAIRLQVQGFSVELWEKNARLGGKLQRREQDGFTWGTGPSLLTMPEVLRDLFRAGGDRLEDHLDMVRLPNACRYFWPDGSRIDEDEVFWQRPPVQRFLAYARGIYELSGEAYLNYPPSQFHRAFQLQSLARLRHLPKIATFRTLAAKVDEFFTEEPLRQIFQRFATYNGSSPFLTPATFNIIPYVEQHFGAWYPRGGMFRIAEELGELAVRRGVTVHPGTEIVSYDGVTATAADGRTARPDHLISNQDVLQSAQTWLRSTYSTSQRNELLRPALSTSALLLFLGVSRRYDELSHHNIFFPARYRDEFRDLFQRGTLPVDPTIYIAITARQDPEHAPEGQDNMFVLINAPAQEPGAMRSEEVEAYRDQVLESLERRGLTDLRRQITVQHTFTSADFAQRDLSHRGSLYGWASHSIRTSLLRPPLRHPRLPQVHFVGGTTHPGGGIPLVLLSGKMVAETVQRSVSGN